ncbi:2Fe-2S iron-sulfur cluster-binding protein [Yersinia intermedia]|uniref:2Fe-2S ferredoxin-type domain-containing protein n=1 Tax=Yersinia intermedia TaxID=631 RepID=A0A208ZVV5_YERIN|nr:2Fe-2S iron-sulfur cluster binding domain-containing protein [Yersinia intermedia]OVZ84558.1 hypothetical protein CBW57_15660 [Yersinia intermedia]
MYIKNLLVKGAIHHHNSNPVVSKLNVSRFDPYGYNKECSVYEVRFNDEERNTSLLLEFVNLYDTCYMRDAIYSGDHWNADGLLMSISISFYMTSYEKYIIVGSYLFESISNTFKYNSNYPELTLVESEYKGGKAFYIYYSPEKIRVSHRDDIFSVSTDNTILDSAIENDIELKHMCKVGICMKCRKKILSGACMAAYSSDESNMVKVQHVLTCNYKALTSLVIG